MSYLITTILITTFIPLNGFAAEDVDTLKPNQLFESLKDSITIPFDVPKVKEDLPTPDEALEKITPKLKEFSRGVEEEAGIDLAKFLGWLAGILQWVFQLIVSALESLADVFRL